MKSTLITLRYLIRSLINEAYASNVDGPHISNVLSQHLADRDPIPHLGVRSKKDDDEIAAHLMEPEVNMEDCYGPVPPLQDEPGVFSDPFTKDYHVIPNPATPGRGR